MIYVRAGNTRRSLYVPPVTTLTGIVPVKPFYCRHEQSNEQRALVWTLAPRRGACPSGCTAQVSCSQTSSIAGFQPLLLLLPAPPPCPIARFSHQDGGQCSEEEFPPAR
jgi:hypothetical protein